MVQPITRTQIVGYGDHGPGLQQAMFAEGTLPNPTIVNRLADQARTAFADI